MAEMAAGGGPAALPRRPSAEHSTTAENPAHAAHLGRPLSTRGRTVCKQEGAKQRCAQQGLHSITCRPLHPLDE